MSLIKLKQDWENLGKIDPFWAILSIKDGKFGKWDISSFFDTGYYEIENLFKNIIKSGYPFKRESALDFGCGTGRCTRALAKYFKQCYGLDIAESMIHKAKELNASISNCKFIVNAEDNLRIFPNNHFDLIYSNIVLQHIFKKSIIKSYIQEFIRILKKNGLLVFQLPSYIPFRYRLQIRRRLYSLLRMLNFNVKFLYQKLRLHPIKLNFISEKEIINLLKKMDVNILEIQPDLSAGSSVQSKMYYVTK